MTTALPRSDRHRYLEMLDDELESAWLYERLAGHCGTPDTAVALRALAADERRHAAHWAGLLGDPALLDRPVRPSLQTRLLLAIGRVFGVRAVLARLRAAELTDIRRYEEEPAAGALADEEREHRAALGLITGREAESENGLAGMGAAGTFRAALFGFNDGLVSNLSLVAGVAGVSIESDAVLVAGVAGLLAGAFSMGAGEYISVRSQTELFENLLAHERKELELDPAEERRELIDLYRRKGISIATATALADELMADPAHALDTMAREELGLDPDNLGSPWAAAIGSFMAFALGAILPVLPFLLGSGWGALIAAVATGAGVLLIVGALTSVLTGRHPLFAGVRMLAIGMAATGVTFGVGSILPISL